MKWTHFLFYRQDCGQRHAPITILSLYQPMKASVFMKIAPTRSLRFEKAGSHCHPYGNGITNNIIRSINRCLLLKPDAEKILSSRCNARIKLPKQLDGSKGFLTVELAHNNPNATVFWHLDETYQAQTQDFHKISLQPAAGKHSLTAVDGEGNTISTTFFVE